MDADEITETYAECLRCGDVEGYLRQLAHDGLGWWFNMEIPRIALHLQAVREHLPVAPPSLVPRLRFLATALAAEDTSPALIELHDLALSTSDRELAAAAAGAGCGAVWDSGYDFRDFAPWLVRIDSLLETTPVLSPLARASLLGFKANAQMNGSGDLAAVTATCRAQILAAEEAHSTSLRIFHAALQTYCHLWNGSLASAGVLLRDAEYLCASGDAAWVAQVFLQSSRGLFHTINGEPALGREILEATVAQPLFEQMPPSVWLLAQANLLFAIANCDDRAALEAVAERIQQRAVPQRNAFHHSFVHFSLGIAALGLGEPHRALAHAEQAIDRGLAAHSAVTARMPVLLKIQALADLHRDEAALALIDEWMMPWLDSGFCTVAATAAQEAAHIELQRGRRRQADEWYRRAQAAMPAGEPLVMFHRPPCLIASLCADLAHAAEGPEVSLRPIRIYCLGGLRVEVGDKVIYDRKWRGGRTKALLKALIVDGGKKVDMNRLADLLWPDAEGDQASRNLKVLVWRLRRLGLAKGQEPLPWLLIQHGHLSLSDEYCRVDVFAFESALHHALRRPTPDWAVLRRVLDSYAGDFLPTDNSETWIIEHRERLRRRYVEAVLVLADVAPDAASREDSVACLQRALEIDELDERLYQRLMRIYLDLGYPAKALEIYHAAQAALQRGLAIVPGPVLVALAREAGGQHRHH